MQNKAALLVIDVQNDFCPGGALAVANGDAVVPIINQIAQNFETVVITQDWHPAGHISFAASHWAAKSRGFAGNGSGKVSVQNVFTLLIAEW